MLPEHLATAAQAKRAVALGRAEVALRDIARTGEPVSFQAVARHAGVSRQWLYKQPQLRSEIERLRTARPAAKPALPPAERATEASLRQRVEGLLDENRRLRPNEQASSISACEPPTHRRTTRKSLS